MPVLSSTGSTTAEVPVVFPLQGNIVRQSEDVGNHAPVLNHVIHHDTYPLKIHYLSQNHNIATVDLVRQLWLAEQADIDRFQSVHGEEDVCAICLDPLKAKAGVVTKCQHVFHLDCCMKSEKSTSSLCKTGCWTCPCCREVVSRIIISPVLVKGLQASTEPHESFQAIYSELVYDASVSPADPDAPVSHLATTDLDVVPSAPLSPRHPATMQERQDVAPAAELDLDLTRWACPRAQSEDDDVRIVHAGPEGAVVITINPPTNLALVPLNLSTGQSSRRDGGLDAFDVAQRVIQQLVFSHDCVIGSRNIQTGAHDRPGVLRTIIEWDYELVKSFISIAYLILMWVK
jgi:hypothetical protein